MFKAWPFTLFISVWLFIYGITSLIQSPPFFVDWNSHKVKWVQWLYEHLGAYGTGFLLTLFGIYVFYLAYREFKNGTPDFAHLTACLLFRFIVAAIIVVGAFLSCIF